MVAGVRGRAPIALAVAAAGLLATASPAAAVTPFADCVVPPQPPAVSAKVYFGYANAGAQRTIAFGDDNQIVPGLSYQGQPEVFNSGTYERVFAAVWNTQVFPGIQWNLDGTGGLANVGTPHCVAGATGPLSGLTPTSATLNGFAGVAGQQTTYHFEWGSGAAPDLSSAPETVGPGQAAPVELALSGLRPQTLYRYRLVAADGDGVTTGATRTFTTPAAPLAPVDLALAQQLAPAALPAGGGSATATLTVTNTSATDGAGGVVATDLLPAAATFLPERSPGCTAADRVVSCPLGTLAPGASASATVAFAIAATGSAVNTAVVVGEQPDPQRLNDVAAAAVSVAAPAEAAPPGPMPPGGTPAPPGGTPAPPGGSPAPPGGTRALTLRVRPLTGRAVPAAPARRCAHRTAAALAITSSDAARATVTAGRGRATVAGRRVALARGRTIVVLCLNARGQRLAGGGTLTAIARVTARSATAGGAVASARIRFARR